MTRIGAIRLKVSGGAEGAGSQDGANRSMGQGGTRESEAGGRATESFSSDGLKTA